MNSQKFDSINMIKFILTWKYHLMVVLLVSAISSVVISSPAIMKPMFRSYAILYPVNLITFSGESPSEQVLQVLESMEIKRQLMKDFRLYEHYDIDSTTNASFDYLINQLNGNLTIAKTEFEAIQIACLDENAQYASDMIDSLISYYNNKVRKLHRNKITEYAIDKHHILSKIIKQRDSLNNRLVNLLIDNNIANYRVQANELEKLRVSYFAKGIAESPVLKSLQKHSNHLAKFGTEISLTDSLLQHINRRYFLATENYNQVLSEKDKIITYAQVITKPFVAEKKAWPIRWIVVLVIVTSSLVLSVIVIFLIGTWRNTYSKLS